MIAELQLLELDTLELQIAGHRGVTRACPFCGRYPMLRSSFREDTGIYQGKLSCDYHCMAGMSFNAMTRVEAQKGVIENWNRRAQQKEPTHD